MMKLALRRGACPSLSAPMVTGDGLLVRLSPRHGSLTPRQLSGIADAARRYGNGLVEITARGSLQIRGLTQSSAVSFADSIAALGIAAEDGPEIRIGALAGRDIAEIADPRPLAAAVRRAIVTRGLNGRLAPKVSVTVDGGGMLGLAGLVADVRLQAVPAGARRQWLVSVGGNTSAAYLLGQGGANAATETAADVLSVLAEKGPMARGRDLEPETLARLARRLGPAVRPLPKASVAPVGVFHLRDGMLARGFVPAFGQIEAAELTALARAMDQHVELRLGPGRGLLALGLSEQESERLREISARYGLIAEPDDPRLKIVTCAGAPACASGHLPTKAIARAVVHRHPDLLAGLPALHISGCVKQCARPSGPSLTVIGRESGVEIVPDHLSADNKTRRTLVRLAGASTIGGRRRA